MPLYSQLNRTLVSEGSKEAEQLRKDVECALERAMDAADVLPMLHRLSRTAAAGSEESIYAHRQLAELLVEKDPWRAALHARSVLASRPEDDKAWAVLALTQTLLNHFKYAAEAYRRALKCAPKNPWYAHNLGHLLDVALGRPEEALQWLRAAYARKPKHIEIVASYVHALARSGQLTEAKRILSVAMKSEGSTELAALYRWVSKESASRDEELAEGRGARRLAGDSPRRGRSRVSPIELEDSLLRGMENLPFDDERRAHAMDLADDALEEPIVRRKNDQAADALAAAIAYAIVFVDRLPLTQAEVAASFRVPTRTLRARFNELRTRLGILPADARYKHEQA